MKYLKIFIFLFFIYLIVFLNCTKEKPNEPEPVAQNIKSALFTNDGNKLTKINPANYKILWQKGDFTFRKHYISADASDGSCWIASLNPDLQSSTIYKFDADGNEIKKILGFHAIKGIFVNSTNGNCAIVDSVDRIAQNLIVLNKNGDQLFSKESIYGVPFYNTLDNTIWVTGMDSLDNHWIFIHSSSGELINQFSGYDGCCDIAFDYTQKKAFLAISSTPGAFNIIDFAGNLIFEKTVGGLKGFSDVQAVAVDLKDGSGWVVDAGNGRMVKISHDGQEVAIVTDVGFSTAANVYSKNRFCFVAASELNKLQILDANGTKKNSINLLNPVNLCIIRYKAEN